MSKLNLDVLMFIFNELQSDKKSLYSCLLVNREWCRIVVPILWKSAWFNDQESEQKVFSIILFCLPSYSKQLLSDYDVKLQLPLRFSTKPLFKYISFCAFPDNSTVYNMTEMILKGDYRSQKQVK